MSSIEFKKDAKGNITDVVIKEGTFYYTNLKTPRPIYDDRKLPIAQARKEYSIEVAVSEEVADEWDEVFAKQPSKKYTNAKFMEKYKLEDKADLPFPDEKKQFTIKIVQKAQKKDGEPISAKLIPRALMVVDGKGKDITFEQLIGNGSKGNILCRVATNDYGSFAYLYRVRVDELVEYEIDDTSDEKDFLGVDEVELAEAPQQSSTKSESKPAGKADADDDGDDDLPDPEDF